LSERDSLFQFPDVNKLTIFVDNVIPCVLIKEGILIPSESLKNSKTKSVSLSLEIENKKELFEEDIDLRSTSIVACERIVKLTNGKMNSVDLDFYIWGILGKEKEYKKLERHITCETIYY
jgi:hypothetical protein